MKANPKAQLIGLIKGLKMDAGVPMEELLNKPVKYFEETGTTFARLATIGYEAIEKERKKKEKKRGKFGAFGKNKKT